MSDTVPFAERRTLLGMPGYGEISAAAALGFYRASANMHRVDQLYVHGSLLAQNFNRLWCSALNKRHRGERCDYFAMQHSDVEPRHHWLDLMLSEMEERNLDILGAAVPIKDDNGITSIALAHPTGDPWRILCRLTLSEVWKLPETFTSEDVGHPLLLNTGLWVCRFNPEWAEQIKFTINDRIVFNTKLDCYMPQVEPEDWNFSRQCHALGLKIGVTRKVPLMHLGLKQFTNVHPWGKDIDEAYVKESQVKVRADVPDGWKFPDEVDGWLTYEEGVALANLAKGKRVLEIGSYCGRSTICMAQTAKIIAAIDPHDGRGTPRQKDTLREMKENLQKYGVQDKVEICKLTSAELATHRMKKFRFDLAFIDGAHDLESVRLDIAAASTHLESGGLLAFHDYRKYPGHHDNGWDPGVNQAVDELIESGGELIDHRGTVAVVRPPAKVPAAVA